MGRLNILREIEELTKEQKGSEKMNKNDITISISRYNELLKKEVCFDKFAKLVKKDDYATELEKCLFEISEDPDTSAEGDDF